MDLHQIAAALGGVVQNGSVLAPGPGHSPADRGLSVKLDVNAPDGFLVYSFANDDPITCKDYVREADFRYLQLMATGSARAGERQKKFKRRWPQ